VLPVRWIASYPRSGNRITRNLLANYLVDGPATDEDMGRVAPDVTGLAARGGLLPTHGPNPVVGGTFLLPDAPLLRRYAHATGRVAYLVRDPREVIPSAVRHLGIAEPHRAEIARRLLADGLTDLTPGMWGRWEQHVLAWTRPERLHRFFPAAEVLVVRFEDLRADPAGALRTIVAFLEIDDPRDPRRVERALEYITAKPTSPPERRPSYETFIHQPHRGPQPRRRGARTLADLGGTALDTYLGLLRQDGDFARCVRQFTYET
jgi:hypothetical protein